MLWLDIHLMVRKALTPKIHVIDDIKLEFAECSEFDSVTFESSVVRTRKKGGLGVIHCYR